MEERVRHFKGLIEAGSFTKAAQELHVSQPALSTSVNKLERELHVLLLNRRHKPLTPTPAGRLVYKYALEYTLHKKQLLESLSMHNGVQAELRVGMIDSLAEIFCNNEAALATLEANHQTSLIINNTSALKEAVKIRLLDFAFIVGVDEAASESLIGYEPMVHVAATGQPTNQRFISYNRESVTFTLIEKQLKEAGVPMDPAFYSTSPEVMLRLILLGRGSAVLPYLTVKSALEARQLAVLPIGQALFLRRPIKVISSAYHQSLEPTAKVLKKSLAKLEKAAGSLVPSS